MSRLPAVVFLTISFFSLAKADHHTQAKQPCNLEVLSPYKKDQFRIKCSNITDFSDVLQAFTSAYQRLVLTQLSIRRSPQLAITRADMDNPAFTNLDALLLKYNGMTTFNSELFRGLTHLKWILLNNNNLTSITADTFAGLENVKEIYVEENQITAIDSGAFKACHNLTELLLNKNKLTSLDARTFAGLSKLTLLGLSGNKFTSISAGTFDSLTSLQILDLRHTQLESLESGLFENTHLLSLILGGTNMKNIENFHLNIPTLEGIMLTDCNIHTITAKFFEHLPNLIVVEIGSNKISKIDENLFTYLPELRVVNFNNNNLTSMSVSSFAQMHQILQRWPPAIFNRMIAIPTLILEDNPWNCQTDEMKELHDWMGAHNLTFYDYFKCNN